MKFDINILLDRSGSMENSQKKDHIGGMRSFVNDQKGKGDTKFTLVQFDSADPFELVYDGVDIESVNTNNIDLIPRGGTPLLDAVGRTVAHIQDRVKNETDTQVVLMIISDGGENSSKEWTKAKVQEAIKSKENDWKILYLGTNVDAYSEAYNLGIGINAAVNFANTTNGVDNAYKTGFSKLNNMRSSYSRGLDKGKALESANYTVQDRIDCADGNVSLAAAPKILTTDNSNNLNNTCQQ